MAKSSDSLFVPATSPTREHDNRRYNHLAKAKGWTKDQLRKCGDLPKKKLPQGIKLVRMPADVFEDPFKTAQHKDDDHEYNLLEKRFYERLASAEITERPTNQQQTGGASITQKTMKTTKSVAEKIDQQ